MQTYEKKESTVERETDEREKEMARERQKRERERENMESCHSIIKTTCNYFNIPNFLEQLTFLCFEVYRPTPEFFTHMETSPVPVNTCRF